MNTKITLAAAFLSLATLVIAPPARADAGTWEGSGIASDATTGADIGPFTITLLRREVGPGKSRMDGTIKTADHRTIIFWQETEEKGPRGFKVVSSNGSGGGRCFTNGMCQSYEQRPDGHAFATTIAKDGEGKLRVLVTELENGKAVRFFEQTLLKKS